jgi:hypothetical protein
MAAVVRAAGSLLLLAAMLVAGLRSLSVGGTVGAQVAWLAAAAWGWWALVTWVQRSAVARRERVERRRELEAELARRAEAGRRVRVRSARLVPEVRHREVHARAVAPARRAA